MRRERLPELDTIPEYRWHATHTVRAYAHYALKRRTLGSWQLAGNHSRNGELWLSDGSYKIRILHALDSTDVPPPGSNEARRAFYCNSPLPLPLFGPINDRLLVLWRIDDNTSVASFRVVRPIGSWKWGTYAKTDLDFMLPETGADLESLKFEPTDEDLGLDLPNEDEQEGGAEDAGGFSG
jgi:hypothetical protein